MDKLIMAAPAKINLGLDILGKNTHGYHLVDMVMARISLCDEVCVEKTSESISVSCDNPHIPDGEANIAYRAADAFFSAMPVRGGAKISIKKRIPQSAGLAGGSADAAAVLKLLNKLYETGLSDERLEKIAVKIGADVPYCLHSAFARAEGIGEKLTFIESPLLLSVVVVKPPISISTKWAYMEMDKKPIKMHPHIEQIISYLKQGDQEGLMDSIGNVFYDRLGSRFSEIGQSRDKLMDSGAKVAMMSGSGPSVFGIFDSEEAAEEAVNVLKSQGLECYAGATLS